MKRLILRNDALTLELVPELGGAVASFCWRHPNGRKIDIFRPMVARPAALPADVELASVFPLTPFSNRVRDGRFCFDGREISMPRNTPGPHVEHGHGWQRPWQVVDLSAEHAVLNYRHHADSWPFEYFMEMRFQLINDRLQIRLVTRNDTDRVMPYGFGLHPYFPKTPECSLYAHVTGMWENDAEEMPVRHHKAPLNPDLEAGLKIVGSNLDNVFSGWDGNAQICWPELDTRLEIAAGSPLGFLVVYSPPNEDYFCAEPVSNCTDAFNLHAMGQPDTGTLRIEPGATVSAKISFSPLTCAPEQIAFSQN